eukprot:5726779-Prymnesium_polylepis.1
MGQLEQQPRRQLEAEPPLQRAAQPRRRDGREARVKEVAIGVERHPAHGLHSLEHDDEHTVAARKPRGVRRRRNVAAAAGEQRLAQ